MVNFQGKLHVKYKSQTELWFTKAMKVVHAWSNHHFEEKMLNVEGLVHQSST